MAAEIRSAARSSVHSRSARFNEAAANGRGNHTVSSPKRRKSRRFNEAAANGRGNLGDVFKVLHQTSSFNEAAANGRGNPLATLVGFTATWRLQ